MNKLKNFKKLFSLFLGLILATPQFSSAQAEDIKNGSGGVEALLAAARASGDSTSAAGSTGARGRTDDSATAGQTTVGPVSVGCPFQPPSTTVMSLVNQVQSSLRSIQREEASCNQATQALIQDAQNQLQALSTMQTGEVFSNTPGTINCTNYENLLRQQFDLAVASKSGSVESTLNFDSPYYRCRNESDFNACAERTYVGLLSAQEQSCRNRRTGQDNQAIRSSLNAVTRSLEAIIESAGQGGCSPDTTQAIVQTAIAQATTTASMAAGFGLVGTGISLVGRLFSSLANRLFNNNSAERYLRLIANDVNNPSRFCLFYDVQKAALRCDQDVYTNALIVGGVSMNTNICDDSRRAITSLIDLSRTLTSETSRQALLEQLESPVGSTGRKYVDMLRDANQFLRTRASQNPASNDGARNRALTRVLNLYDQLRSNAGDDSDDAVERSTTLRTDLLAALSSEGLNLPEVLQDYLTSSSSETASAGGGATPAAALATNSNVIEIIRRTNAQIQEAKDYVTSTARNNTDSAVMDRLLSAVNSTIGPSLERELETIFNQYKNDAGEDLNTERQLLGRMLNICMSTQGAAYFNRDDTVNARQNLRREPISTYNNICNAFDCGNNSMFVPLNRFQTPATGISDVEKFRRYQCDSDRRTASATQNLNSRISALTAQNSQLPNGQVEANRAILQSALRNNGGYDALKRRVCGSN